MGQGWEEGVREPLSQERALHQSGQKSGRSGFKSWPHDPDRLPDLALSLDFPICKMGIKIISL